MVVYRFNAMSRLHVGWLCCVLLALNPAWAGKKLTLYQCQSTDGHVVTQDRPCSATHLRSLTSGQQNTDAKKAGLKPQPKALSHAMPQPRYESGVSPDEFIDIIQLKNWHSTLKRSHHGWQLLIDVPGQRHVQSSAQVSVHYYRNPKSTLNEDAFSYALNLYHTIRHQYQSTDSQFKAHSAYKIFNIVYQKSSRLAQTDFYMGKLDGSLWVFTLESYPGNSDKARQLMAQLQSLL